MKGYCDNCSAEQHLSSTGTCLACGYFVGCTGVPLKAETKIDCGSEVTRIQSLTEIRICQDHNKCLYAIPVNKIGDFKFMCDQKDNRVRDKFGKYDLGKLGGYWFNSFAVRLYAEVK